MDHFQTVDVRLLPLRRLEGLRRMLKEFGGDEEFIINSMTTMTQYAIVSKTGKIISILSVRPRGKSYCGSTHSNMIYNVVTSPYHRQKGYMTNLMKHTIRKLRYQKKRYIHLEVLKNNYNAIRLYKKLGFQIIANCTVPHSSYIMRLRLSSCK